VLVSILDEQRCLGKESKTFNSKQWIKVTTRRRTCQSRQSFLDFI